MNEEQMYSFLLLLNKNMERFKISCHIGVLAQKLKIDNSSWLNGKCNTSSSVPLIKPKIQYLKAKPNSTVEIDINISVKFCLFVYSSVYSGHQKCIFFYSIYFITDSTEYKLVLWESLANIF